jgi:hexokinase
VLVGLVFVPTARPDAAPRQDRIDHGVLIRWTKGFGAPNVEGHDVVEMFERSLRKFVRPALPSPTFRTTNGTSRT